MLESLLDEIPLLGEVRRKALLDRFGSVGAIRKATLAQIAEVPGIGEKIALLIEERLASEQSGQSINLGTGEIDG
ncbi:MAG: helix-hairpin-helix domain-containing protein [Actinomycetota bacterium]